MKKSELLNPAHRKCANRYGQWLVFKQELNRPRLNKKMNDSTAGVNRVCCNLYRQSHGCKRIVSPGIPKKINDFREYNKSRKMCVLIV